jgi:hypothetical protein
VAGGCLSTHISQLPGERILTGANIAATETLAVRGPAGASAVLKVSTAHDHSKNSHDCNADYKLVVTPATGGAK